MPSITGTLTNSGESTALVAVPAGQSIQVLGLSLYINDASITVTVKTGSTAKFTCAGLAGTQVAVQPQAGGREPLIQGAYGDDLLINLSGAAAAGVRYNIQYVLK